MTRPTATPLPLWPEPPAEGPAPTLTPYLLDDPQPRGCVMVLPGGGYENLADHEAEPIARWCNRLGLHAAVVHYRIRPNRHPGPLHDAQRGLRMLRHRAGEWGVDPGRIAVLGFSAGGHLAGCCATMFDEPGPIGDAIDDESARPDAAVLCYPVVSFTRFAHSGSAANLLGPDAPAELRQRMSVDQCVTERTPPMFLWHTADDAAVPVANSLILAQALAAASVPFALHVWPSGYHGIGMKDHPVTPLWTNELAEWLGQIGISAGGCGDESPR